MSASLKLPRRVFGAEVERLSSAWSVACAPAACPITEGAAVVYPRRAGITRLRQLPAVEALDLFSTAAAAAAAAQGAPAAFNWSLKDSWSLDREGPAQLHLHLVPRYAPLADGSSTFCRNFAENDMVYGALEAWHPEPGISTTPPERVWPDDDSRTSRSAEDMAEEAMSYRDLGAQGQGDGGAAATPLPATHTFARFTIPQGQLFFATALSVAFVNLKPLVPGHVLVTPRRVVPRYDGLTPEEATDLWRAVLEVEDVLSQVTGACDFDIGMQDGELAGMSVPHVHVHILPK
jgi:diadenosine tetraphosphate (Ap4A) HIT family hydrolase